MLNSDVLRRIRYALNLSNKSVLQMFRLGGMALEIDKLESFLKKEEEEGYSPLNAKNMTAFLDGLIIKKRGVRESTSISSSTLTSTSSSNTALASTSVSTSVSTSNSTSNSTPAHPSPIRKEIFNNNLILRKLKIALELKEEDILAILKRSEMEISKSELSALFRHKGHKNYKDCGDQLLRNFIAGLAGYKKAEPIEKKGTSVPQVQ
ncbi:MAG: DUF1456 family protein [Candidatus Ozemobacteraceae bacterium]